MNITNVPNSPMFDEGGLHPSWRIFFSQLTTQMQTFLTDENYILPQPDSSRLDELNLKKHEGGLYYDTESNTAKLNTENNSTDPGTQSTYKFKTMVTYEELTAAQVAAIPSGQRNGRIIYKTDSMQTVLGTNNAFITL